MERFEDGGVRIHVASRSFKKVDLISDGKAARRVNAMTPGSGKLKRFDYTFVVFSVQVQGKQHNKEYACAGTYNQNSCISFGLDARGKPVCRGNARTTRVASHAERDNRPPGLRRRCRHGRLCRLANIRRNLSNLGWLALGLAVCAAYTAWCVQTATFALHATRTEGTVIDTEPHRSVSMTLPDGTIRVFTQNGHLDARIGEHVPVGYLDGAPQQTARVITFGALWAVPLGFLPAALGFGVAPIAAVILDTRAKRRG